MNTEQIKPEPMSEDQLKGIKKNDYPDIFVSYRQNGLRHRGNRDHEACCHGGAEVFDLCVIANFVTHSG